MLVLLALGSQAITLSAKNKSEKVDMKNLAAQAMAAQAALKAGDMQALMAAGQAAIPGDGSLTNLAASANGGLASVQNSLKTGDLSGAVTNALVSSADIQTALGNTDAAANLQGLTGTASDAATAL